MTTLRLALGNVRKSWRDYAVYFATLALGVALFYAFNTIDAQVDMLPRQRQMVASLAKAIFHLTWFLAAVLGFLMMYANNFLVRRRARELALYQVLGMRRRRVAAILGLETALSSLAALAAGLAFGAFASQFLVFVTARVMGDVVSDYHFVFSPRALALTAGVFVTVFALTLVLNLATLGRLQLTELMSAGSRNEESRLARRAWLAALAFAAGAVLVGLAYWRLSRDGYPFVMVTVGTAEGSQTGSEAAWRRFGATTLMAFGGTYLLFFSCGGALLAAARRSRTAYWRGLTMFTVRELGARVRTSAASMATISLVLFVMLSVVSASFGVAAALRTSIGRFSPHDLTFTVQGAGADLPKGSGSSRVSPLAMLEDRGATRTSRPARAETPASGLFEGHAARWASAEAWSMTPWDFSETGGAIPVDVSAESPGFVPGIDVFLAATGNEDLEIAGARLFGTGMQSLDVVAASDHNRLRALAGLEPLDVPDGTYAISSSTSFGKVQDIYRQVLDSGTEIPVLGERLVPAGSAAGSDGRPGAFDSSAASVFRDSFSGDNMGTLIVPDSMLAPLAETTEGDMRFLHSRTDVVVDFDEELSDAEILAASRNLAERFGLVRGGDADSGAGASDSVPEKASPVWMLANDPTSQASLRSEVLAVTGFVTFIGVYLGLVLTMAAAMILAIKVLSGAAEARPRFRRLRDLGCPKALASRSLATQAGLVFALPLALAVAHACVALRVASDVISLLVPLSLTDSMLLAGGFVLAIFAAYHALTFVAARRLALARE